MCRILIQDRTGCQNSKCSGCKMSALCASSPISLEQFKYYEPVLQVDCICSAMAQSKLRGMHGFGCRERSKSGITLSSF